jgi:uncharacterized repeat protein (TIGR01451 family)
MSRTTARALILVALSLTASTAFAQSADLAVVQTDSPDPVDLGSNLTYTITVTNAGPDPAPGVTMNHSIPLDTTFVSLTVPAGWTPTTGPVGGTDFVMASNPSFAAGGVAVFTLVVNVNPSTTANQIVGVVTISGGPPDPNLANNADTDFTAVNAGDVRVTKADGGGAVTAGSTINYQITVSNDGVIPAADVSLTDALPAGTTHVSFMQTGGATTFATAFDGTTYTATAPSMPPGSAFFQITVDTSPSTPAGTIITNTATVSSSTPDPDSANNSATTNTTVSASANLDVFKTEGADPVAAGALLTYTIQVFNNGFSDAQSVTLSDDVPANTTLVSFTAPAGWSVTAPPSGGTGTITASLANMPTGSSGTFNLAVAVNPSTPGGTIITNTATISSTTTDPDPEFDVATETTTVSTPAGADLSVTKVAGAGPFVAGGNVTYTITVSNAGPSAATNVTALDTLPAGTTFVSATPSQGSCTGTSTVSCALGTIASGGSATVALVIATSTTPGFVLNTVNVSATETDANMVNNVAFAPVITIPAAAPIPTMSEWTLLLLMLGLAGLGVAFIRSS